MLVSADVVAVIEHLEIAMGLHDPGNLLADKGFQDRCGVFVVVVGGIDVADIMQKRGHNPVDIGPVAPGAGG